jgi:hypothetical protein
VRELGAELLDRGHGLVDDLSGIDRRPGLLQGLAAQELQQRIRDPDAGARSCTHGAEDGVRHRIGVVAELVKLYVDPGVYGSSLPPFVDVPPEPVKPLVPERSGNVTVSTPLGSLAVHVERSRRRRSWSSSRGRIPGSAALRQWLAALRERLVIGAPVSSPKVKRIGWWVSTFPTLSVAKTSTR